MIVSEKIREESIVVAAIMSSAHANGKFMVTPVECTDSFQASFFASACYVAAERRRDLDPYIRPFELWAETEVMLRNGWSS